MQWGGVGGRDVRGGGGSEGGNEEADRAGDGTHVAATSAPHRLLTLGYRESV